MRLSHEVKEAKGRTPLRILVDFLRVWYDRDELVKRLESAPPEASITRLYFSEARQRSEVAGNLRLQMFREEAEGIDLAECDEHQLSLLRDLKNESDDPGDALRYGMALAAHGHYEEACEALTSGIEHEDAPGDGIVIALFMRGLSRGARGDIEGEITDYTAMIEREDTPSDWVAMALVDRGFAHGKRGDIEGAIADYTAVIAREDAPANQIARALFYRGVAHEKRGDAESSITDCTAVIELEDAPPSVRSRAHFLVAGMEMQRSRWVEAESHLRSGFAQIEDADSRYVGWIPEYLRAVLASGQSGDAWAPRGDALLEIYSENNAVTEFAAGLVDSLAALRDSNLSSKGLAEWHALWTERARTHPELELPARLLRTAIDYFTAREDESVLLDLPSEERRILAQALGLESTAREPDTD